MTLITHLRAHATALDDRDLHAEAELLRQAQAAIEERDRKLETLAAMMSTQDLTGRRAFAAVHRARVVLGLEAVPAQATGGVACRVRMMRRRVG